MIMVSALKESYMCCTEEVIMGSWEDFHDLVVELRSEVVMGVNRQRKFAYTLELNCC